MPFETQTFAFEEVLTSTKMNQIDTNIDEVRRCHIASAQPPALTDGVLWLDTGSDPWVLKIRRGSGFVDLGLIFTSVYRPPDDSVRRASIQLLAINTARLEEGAVTETKLGTGAVTTAKIGTDAVTAAKIAADAVARTQIRSSTGTVTHNGGAGSTENLTLPGGNWGFYPEVRRADAQENFSVQIANSHEGDAFEAVIGLTKDSGNSDINARQTFVTTSPPFDLGDGDAHGFIFLRMRGGEIVATYSSDTPPWAYNGPTDIAPHQIDAVSGKGYRKVRKCACLLRELREGKIKVGEFRERMASPEYQGCDLVEIDQEMKNRDMAGIPHPFKSSLPDDKVLLLDPMDPVVAFLLEAQAAGEEGISDLLKSEKFRIGTRKLKRNGPRGVLQVSILG